MRNPLTDPRPGDAWLPADKKLTGVQVLQRTGDMLTVRRVSPYGTPILWDLREVSLEEFREGAIANGAVCVSLAGEPVT